MTSLRNSGPNQEVLTLFGWGIVKRVRDDGFFEIALDWGSVHKSSQPSILFSKDCDIFQSSFCGIGECILTKYGTGVLTGYQRDTGIHVVRLWTPRGMGSANGFLNKQDIISKISTAVGFITQTPVGEGECLSVCQTTTDIIYRILINGTVKEFHSSDPLTSLEARVLPIAEILISDLEKQSVSLISSVSPSMLGSLNFQDQSFSLEPWINFVSKFISRQEERLQTLLNSEFSLKMSDLPTFQDLRASLDSRLQQTRALVQAALKQQVFHEKMTTLETLLEDVQQNFNCVFEAVLGGSTLSAGERKKAIKQFITQLRVHLSTLLGLIQSISSQSNQTGSQIASTLKSSLSSAVERDAEMLEMLRKLRSDITQSVNKFFSLDGFLSKEKRDLIQSSFLNTRGARRVLEGGEALRQRMAALYSSTSSSLSTVTITSTLLPIDPDSLDIASYLSGADQCLELVSSLSSSALGEHVMEKLFSLGDSVDSQYKQAQGTFNDLSSSDAFSSLSSQLSGINSLQDIVRSGKEYLLGEQSLPDMTPVSSTISALSNSLPSTLRSLPSYLSRKTSQEGLTRSMTLVFRNALQGKGLLLTNSYDASHKMNPLRSLVYSLLVSISYHDPTLTGRDLVIFLSNFEYISREMRAGSERMVSMMNRIKSKLSSFDFSSSLPSAPPLPMLQSGINQLIEGNAELGEALQPLRSLVDHASVSNSSLNVSTKDVIDSLQKINVDKLSASLSSTLTLENACTVLQKTLDSEGAEKGAEHILSAGDSLVSKLESIQQMDSVQLAVAHLRGTKFNLNPLDTVKSVAAEALPDLSGSGSVLSIAERALLDEDARNRLINGMKDKVLDFLLSYIPTISLGGLDGVINEVAYSISALDMSGFRFSKEGVDVKFTPDLNADSIFSFCARDITAKFSGVQWNFLQNYFPNLSGEGSADASVDNAAISLGFRLVRLPKGSLSALNGPEGRTTEGKKILKKFPALAKLVRTLKQAVPSSPSASVTSPDSVLSPEVIRTQQEAVWGQKHSTSDPSHTLIPEEWEPALVISQRSIVISSVSLVLEDKFGLAWLYNALISAFSDSLKNYVQQSLLDLLGSSSASLLSPLNAAVGDHWPLLSRLLSGAMGLDIKNLPPASAEDFHSLMGPETDSSSLQAQGPTGALPREWTLKFAEEGSLGLNLEVRKATPPSTSTSPPPPTSENSIQELTVIGVVPGGQAERVLQANNLQLPFIDKAVIISVNGHNIRGLSKADALKSLSSPKPLFIRLRFSEGGYKALKAHHESEKEKEKARLEEQEMIKKMEMRNKKRLSPTGSSKERGDYQLEVARVRFGAGPLGLNLRGSNSCGGVMIIRGFTRTADGGIQQAESSGLIKSGMLILAANGQVVFGRPFEEGMEVLKGCSRPLDMLLVPSPDRTIEVDNLSVLHRMRFAYLDESVMVADDGHSGTLCPSGLVVLAVNGEDINNALDLDVEEDSDETLSSLNSPDQHHQFTLKVRQFLEKSLEKEQIKLTQQAIESTTPESTSPRRPLVRLAVRDMEALYRLISIRDQLDPLP